MKGTSNYLARHQFWLIYSTTRSLEDVGGVEAQPKFLLFLGMLDDPTDFSDMKSHWRIENIEDHCR
jgi:hypothetical protein